MADKKEGEEKDLAAKMEELEVEREEQKKIVTGKMKKLVEALYDLRDTYFHASKEEKITILKKQIKIGLDALNYVPLDELKTTAQRADFELLKGVMLDVLPSYDRKAEEHLVKSVKLNPSSIDAWLALGNCFTKKGELTSAKDCYTRVEKGANKCLLCDLSMVERMLAQEADDKTEMQKFFLDYSIFLARKAIKLDKTDGCSRYNHGNACLAAFLLGYQDNSYISISEYLKVLIIQKNDETLRRNPDLYYNYGTVRKHLESYKRAFTEYKGRDKNHKMDSDPALEEVKSTAIDLLHRDYKISVLLRQSKIFFKILSMIPFELCENLEFLKGSTLNVLPYYEEEAELCLKRAVALNSSSTDAWIALGYSYIKKKDLGQAKGCFETALAQGRTTKIFCCLSDMARMLRDTASSVAYARSALSLDDTNSTAWLCLGNAFFASFRRKKCEDGSMIMEAIKAYQHLVEKSDARVLFQIAVAYKYFGDFEKAVNLFQRIPSRHAENEITSLISCFDQMQSTFKSSMWSNKELAIPHLRNFKVCSSLPFEKATIKLLSEGSNKFLCVVAKVVLTCLKSKIPRFYILADSDATPFLVSAIGVPATLIDAGNVLVLNQPEVHDICLSLAGKYYEIRMIMLRTMQQVVIYNEHYPS